MKEVRELNLKDRLIQAVKNSWTPGAGLAAIQIGIPLRYAWFYFEGRHKELINPRILSGYGIFNTKEGCLSIPDQWIDIDRYYEIEYLNDGKKRTARGFRAHIIQHEVDHMDGVLNDEKRPIREAMQDGVR